MITFAQKQLSVTFFKMAAKFRNIYLQYLINNDSFK